MQILFKFFALLMVAVVAACGGGGGSGGEPGGTQPLRVELPAGQGTVDNPIQIRANQARLFKIIGGRTMGGADGKEKRSYLVYVEETGAVGLSWAKVGEEEASDLFMVQWADGPKQAKITVRDADDKQVVFYVRTDPPEPVELYTSAPVELTLGVGADAARTFDIGGGNAPYAVTVADSNVARVELVAPKQWKITGVAIGQTNVVIRDAAGRTTGVAVKVGAPELRISPEKLTIPVGLKATGKISGGQPPYHVAGGVETAIKTTILGDVLEIEGLLAAKLDVTVADATGQTVKIDVEVNTATTGIRFSPSELVVSENDRQPIDFTVFGAVGNICVFTSDPRYLRPESDGCGTDNKIRLVTGTNGSRCVSDDLDITVSVVDANRSMGTATVTIKDNGPGCGTTGLALTPNAVNVNVDDSNQTSTENDVVITGGSGMYVVTSSNPQLATASVSDNVLTIKGGTVPAPLGAPATVTVTVRDANNPNLSATVTVTVN